MNKQKIYKINKEKIPLFINTFQKQKHISLYFLIQKNSGIKKMASLSYMTKQAEYLYVKQKLDSFNLPTIFPFQSLGLLAKLIQKLQQQTHHNNNHQINSIRASSPSAKQGIELNYNFVDKALRSQLSKIINQNNQLHIDLITLKQQNQARKHCLDKLLVQKSDNKEQVRNILKFRNQKQIELVQQLEVAKFKYNELIDFIHQEDNLQRMYIKRLFNHKKYDIGKNTQQYQRNDKKDQFGTNQQNNENKQTVLRQNRQKKEQRTKDSRKRINKTLQHDHKQRHKQNPGSSHQSLNILQQRISHLQQKLHNRQRQIQRLHAKLTYDGLNLNKVLTSYNDQLQKKKYNEMEERLIFMEGEYEKMKKQVDSMRKKGGRYQALREEVQKCHTIINDLKKQNKNVKRLKKQNDYDLEKQRKAMHRSINSFNTQALDMNVLKHQDNIVIQDLRKKLKFYEKEFGILKVSENIVKSSYKPAKKGVKKSVKVKSSSKKPIKNSKQQNLEHSSSQIRERYQDQINLSIERNGRPQTSSGSRRKPPAQSVSKPAAIRQIPQQQQSSSSQSNLEIQNQIDKQIQKQHKQEQIKERIDNQKRQNNVDNQVQQEQQSDDDDRQGQEQKQTMYQQYQETINQLTNKYLGLKEQLQVKNEEITTLERVIDRLMKEKQGSGQTLQTKQIKSRQKIIERSPVKDIVKDNQDKQTLSQEAAIQISKLSKDVQSLTMMLNQSEFQKQQLRREVIEMQKLYKRISSMNQKQINSKQDLNQSYKQKIIQMQKLLQQKQIRLQEYKLLNSQLQDRLAKSIDRLKRLNDEVQYLTKLKQDLIKELDICKIKLDSVAYVAKEEHRKHSQTIELAQVEKNQIISLRKQLLAAEIKIGELENQVLRKQASKLRH